MHMSLSMFDPVFIIHFSKSKNVKIHQLFPTISPQIDLLITLPQQVTVFVITQNDLAPCRHNVKPFGDPDDDYMYSRICEVKSHCQLTHYGKRKHLGNVIWVHMALPHWPRPTSQIPPCTCSIFHAPLCTCCSRNVQICGAHWCKIVVIEYLTDELWDLKYGSTVYSSQWTDVQSGVFSVWFIHKNLKWP